MRSNRQILAILLAALLIVALTSSMFFLAAEADHDCTGEHCAICEQMYICAQTVKLLSMWVLLASIGALLCAAGNPALPEHVGAPAPETLVSHKIKLTC